MAGEATRATGGDIGISSHGIDLIIQEHKSSDTRVEHDGLVGERIKRTATCVGEGIKPGREESGTVSRSMSLDDRRGDSGGGACGGGREPRLSMQKCGDEELGGHCVVMRAVVKQGNMRCAAERIWEGSATGEGQGEGEPASLRVASGPREGGPTGSACPKGSTEGMPAPARAARRYLKGRPDDGLRRLWPLLRARGVGRRQNKLRAPSPGRYRALYWQVVLLRG